MSDKLARLRAMLEEDTGSVEEAERLLPVIERLRQWSAPETGAAPPSRLIDTLLAEMPPHESWRVRARHWLTNGWPWVLLRAQVRVVRGEIWLASLLVIALGTLVTFTQVDPQANGDQLPLVMVSPLIAALGIAFIYGPEVDPPFEILLATPVSPRLVLMARLALVFGFNLGLGLAGSVILAALRTDLSIWPLIMAWLAPMAFLSALAFCIGVVTRESLLSSLSCFVLWMTQVTEFPSWRPDLLAASARPWLLVMAIGLGMVALWLAGYEERWMREQS
ncbi:MAG: hypothetical protein HY866_17145 [Chloroflexi bacterium]|nr:hypothetical protein [Chloroflexota bacterium]